LRALRGVVEEIDRWFDRRCRPAMAWTKRARRRSHVRHFTGLRPIFQKPPSPNLEKALTLRDDSLPGSTSTAVERSHRRYRKMQKPGDRVRARPTIRGRLALDRFRDAQGPPREQTMKALHHARRR
jgi:hypothetical protein